jgi:uncharacterized protein YdbL (DUF1318 family)
MRKPLTWMSVAALLALPVACVTINVYFPAAAAEAAAEQFVGKVIGGASDAPSQEGDDQPPPGHSQGAMLLDFLVPSAYAQQPDIDIRTPQIQAIQARMKQRFDNKLSKYFASGAIGLTADGLVAIRDASAASLAERAALNPAVADENRDRNAVYREIAVANGHPEWESQIRETFAKQWIAQARAGWYYQDASGAWQRK